MKTLLIIRHAKSSWDDAGMKDFDRPLNERGKRDAPVMAERLLKANIAIDLFVSSTAKRAKSTAEAFMKVYGRKDKELILVQELYHAEIQNFRNVIGSLDDQHASVAVFSHNPGITAFANTLSSARIDDMPTCAIFAVRSEATSWKELLASPASFLFFDYPKSTGSGD